MRRNAAGQIVTAALVNTSNQAMIPATTLSVSGATNATPIVITTTSPHSLIVSDKVIISGVGGNTAANGNWEISATGSTTTCTLKNSVGNGAYTSGGTVDRSTPIIFVSKDGGAPVAGTGTVSHIGKYQDGTAWSASGTLVVDSAGTLGLWSYMPTAAETNASAVSFLFVGPRKAGVRVEKLYEPTSGPILLQTTIATLASQTSFTLAAGSATVVTPSATNKTYTGALAVFYDATNTGEVSFGVISDYTGSTRTVTLQNAPNGYTIAAGDFVTIVPDIAAQYLFTTLADSIPADNTRPTPLEALYMITQFLLERAVSGTTVTVKKVDGSTTLLTCTLDDGTSPTSITRAT